MEKACFSEPWSEASYDATLLLPYAHYFAAELEDGTMIGTIGLQIIAGEGEISNVATLLPYRRSGIAHALVEEALQTGKERGVTDYTLEVRSGNTAAIALYESFGFQTEGVRKNFYREPCEDALIMWKRNG